MRLTSALNLRTPVPWVVGTAAGAALFASGALVARATLDDDEPVRVVRAVAPSVGSDVPASFANQGGTTAANPYGDGDVQGEGPTKSIAPGGYGACRTPLPNGVVGGVIDPAAAGFDMNLPDDGFGALNVSVGSIQDCDVEGNPAGEPGITVDSSWLHLDTDLEASISQRTSSDPVAPVLRNDGASFSADGYVYNIWVNAYPIYPLAEKAERSAVMPVEPDPRAADVVRELVAQLAPSLELKCFWTQAEGDWSSLPGMGIGDPRPVIPAGFTASDIYVSTFNPPAAGCDTSITPAEGASINANWSKGGDGSSNIGISAWSFPAGFYSYPGSISDYSANWSNDRYQFSVWANVDGKPDIELVRALARALDPSFSEQCFITERTLTDADLAAMSLPALTPPAGYSVTRSSMTATDIGAGCEVPEGFEPSYNLNWTLQSGPDTIDASVNHWGGNTGGGGGYINDYGLGWTGADGTSYYVSGYSTGVAGTVSRDAMIAVAQSLDPSLDVSTLSDEDGKFINPGGAVVPAR